MPQPDPFIKFCLRDFEPDEEHPINQAIIHLVQSKLEFKLPEDYLSVILQYNGGEGAVGKKSFLKLFPVTKLVEVNESYVSIMKEAPALYLFGKDNAYTGYAFHKNNHSYLSLRLNSDYEFGSTILLGHDFRQFVEKLYNGRFEDENKFLRIAGRASIKSLELFKNTVGFEKIAGNELVAFCDRAVSEIPKGFLFKRIRSRKLGAIECKIELSAISQQFQKPWDSVPNNWPSVCKFVFLDGDLPGILNELPIVDDWDCKEDFLVFEGKSVMLVLCGPPQVFDKNKSPHY